MGTAETNHETCWTVWTLKDANDDDTDHGGVKVSATPDVSPARRAPGSEPAAKQAWQGAGRDAICAWHKIAE